MSSSPSTTDCLRLTFSEPPFVKELQRRLRPTRYPSDEHRRSARHSGLTDNTTWQDCAVVDSRQLTAESSASDTNRIGTTKGLLVSAHLDYGVHTNLDIRSFLQGPTLPVATLADTR